MGTNWQKPGVNHVPSYQLSGIPYVTSSVSNTEVKASNGGAGVASKPLKISFPYVTKFVTIRNTGANQLRLAFTYSGSYAPGETQTFGAVQSFHKTADNDAISRSTGRHYFLIPSTDDTGNAGSDNSIQTFDIRVKEIHLLGDGGTTGFSMLAGLTGIPATSYPVLTGSVAGVIAYEGVG